jgi:nitrite reductase/ring-hydroxylating ferredoxin subunit
MSEAPDWRPALAEDQLSPDGIHAATAGGHKVIVLRAEGEVIAYRDACPHEGFPLSETGEREDFVLVCNKHLWEFDTATGEHISRLPRPECNLKRYPTRVVDGIVEIDVSAVPAA